MLIARLKYPGTKNLGPPQIATNSISCCSLDVVDALNRGESTMEPFGVPAPLKDLVDPHPPPRLLLDAAGQSGERGRVTLTRLWLTEGIPYAFRKCPAIYESMRSWLAIHLDVHAKEIGIVGSARIGASLAPRKLGKKFSNDSDLDLVIVSRGLFDGLVEEFRHWSLAFEGDTVAAANSRECQCWRENNKRVPKNIESGFLDPKFIPNHEPYPKARRISQSMFLLAGKLKRTPNAPSPSKASVRCYASWDSFERQSSKNLRGCWEEWKMLEHERMKTNTR